MSTETIDPHESHKVTELLKQMPHADAAFARTLANAKAVAKSTHKKASVTLTITIDPTSEVGGLVLRPAVTAKLPTLPQPAVQFQEGARGELLEQTQFLLFGGRDEVSMKPQPIPEQPRSASGRLSIVARPAPAPLAEAPAPKPLAKDAAAGPG